MSAILSGQAALVTGGDSGIGAAIVRAFAQAGAAVGINYRSDEAAAAALGKEISSSVLLQADVSREDEVRAMFERFVERFGRLDILVANAGMQRDGAITELSAEDWRRVLEVNLTGQFLCVREAVRLFTSQSVPSLSKAAGKIICMSSVHELIPWAGHVNYAASKGGVMMMMKSVAQEVAPRRIRVNGIAPGAIKTSINSAAWQDPHAAAKLLELIPYGRIGDPVDVARAALWLASDESDYVTDTTLFVDGGMSLYPGFAQGG